MSLPTGISPLHGSHATVPIACDALNAQTMAVREYHYQTEQVMAKKEDKFFSWTLTVVRSLSLDKVMAYRLQRLADCLTYLTALFSCQRTLERRKSPIPSLVRMERIKWQSSIIFLSDQHSTQKRDLLPFSEKYRDFLSPTSYPRKAKLLQKMNIFLFFLPLHIGNETYHLLSRTDKRMIFFCITLNTKP